MTSRPGVIFLMTASFSPSARFKKRFLKLPRRIRADALLTLFSGVLEFNNMFASYKGEGTGAVRHMFSHHILKPERTPIEANVWGTPKSSGVVFQSVPQPLAAGDRVPPCAHGSQWNRSRQRPCLSRTVLRPDRTALAY